jgi:hypothetical protein
MTTHREQRNTLISAIKAGLWELHPPKSDVTLQTVWTDTIDVIVDGQLWEIHVKRPRRQPHDDDWYRREVVGMSPDEQF